MDLRVLLRHHAPDGRRHALHVVRHTLDKMARGGIYDHLGGGFARYSTDDRWLVPHFEKMLYDNALLALVYLEAFQVTGDPSFARVARETLDYVLGRMTGAEGGFYSTEDADSEGEEGKYYVWSLAEIDQVLGAERAKTFCYVYDVTGAGQLGRQEHPQPAQARSTRRRSCWARRTGTGRSSSPRVGSMLLAVRDRRVPPGMDTKVLVSWNGLMIAALAVAGRDAQGARYLGGGGPGRRLHPRPDAGRDGRLLHTFKDGQAKLNAYLDDYANLIDGLTRLYEATGEPRWIESALELARRHDRRIRRPRAGRVLFHREGHEELIARQKDMFDNATPSGNGMAATALLRLAAITNRDELRQAGRRALEAVKPVLEQAPSAAGQSLIALDFDLSPGREIVVIAGADASESRQVLEAIFSRFLPATVVIPATPAQAAWMAGQVPLLANRPARDGRTTTYVCENYTCLEPATAVEGVLAALDRLAPAAAPGK